MRETKPTDDYKRGYSKGYVAGRRNGWPDHLPPAPPEPVVRELMDALRNLRDQADALIATFEEGDPAFAELGLTIDEADVALAAVSEWIKARVSES